jgi:hypothetical protein
MYRRRCEPLPQPAREEHGKNFGLIATGAFILVLLGVLIGCTLIERWLEVRANGKQDCSVLSISNGKKSRVARQKSIVTQTMEA